MVQIIYSFNIIFKEDKDMNEKKKSLKDVIKEVKEQKAADKRREEKRRKWVREHIDDILNAPETRSMDDIIASRERTVEKRC